MNEDVKKQLSELLDRHIQVLNKKMEEHEDLRFILEVLESLLGKIDSNELTSLLSIEEKELKDLEHLFKSDKEKNLIHKVSGIRYLVAGIHDKHVHIDITKEQKKMIEDFLKLLRNQRSMILPILEKDKGLLEQDKTNQLLDKLQDLNTRIYISEIVDIKNLFVEFEIDTEKQYKILEAVLEHNHSVYNSLKKVME